MLECPVLVTQALLLLPHASLMQSSTEAASKSSNTAFEDKGTYGVTENLAETTMHFSMGPLPTHAATALAHWQALYLQLQQDG